MSSLRLALKQSLQEAGGGSLSSKKKDKRRKKQQQRLDNADKKQSADGRRRRRQPGDPPRKRGRPRKHPLPTPDDEDDDKKDNDNKDPNATESENEFSYSAEEEEEDSSDEEDDDDDDDEEESDENDDGEGEGSHHSGEEDGKEGDHTGHTSSGSADRNAIGKLAKKKRSERHGGDDNDAAPRHGGGEKKKKHVAANKIQSSWKKRKESDASTQYDTSKQDDSNRPSSASPTRDTMAQHRPSSTKKDKSSTSNNNSNSSSSKPRTVPAPEPEVLEWSRNLPDAKCWKHVSKGLRVKVRFATKLRRDGKMVRKRIWYGGRVSAVSKEGSKIRIKYDDGTSEISTFPDRDVVVDATENGTHLVPADKFIPPYVAAAAAAATVEEKEPEEDEEMEYEDEEPTPSHEPPKKVSPTWKEADHSAVEKKEEPATATTEDRPQTPPQPSACSDPEESTKNEEGEQSALKSVTPKHAEAMEEGEMKTPEAKASSDDKKTAKQGLFKDVVSPEEGKLSPGVTPSESVATKPFPEASDTQDVDTPKEDKDIPSESNNALNQQEDDASGSKEKEMEEPDSTAQENKSDDRADKAEKRPSLTIRLSQADANQQDAATPSSPDKTNTKTAFETDSEEEVFADTPVTVRKVRSLEMEASEHQQTGKRKRSGSDDDEDDEAHHTTKRRLSDGYVDVSSLQIPVMAKGPSASPTGSQSKGVGTEEFANDEEMEESQNQPQEKFTSMKKKRKEGVVSPTPGRKSTSGRKSPTGRKVEDGRDKRKSNSESADVDDAENAIGKSSSGIMKSPNATVGSKNSAFTKKKPKGAKEVASLSSYNGEGEREGLSPTLERGDGIKGSTDSLPRAGRRAAQQAKEKITGKPDSNAPESIRKKKKKRRKDRESGNDSDESVDDRPWVQCDECHKWRILPSHVKEASLPTSWYCRLNIHDKERNNCDAPEQSAKHAAKEWRKARKRAKKQLLGQVQKEGQKETSKDGSKSVSLSPKPGRGSKKTSSGEDKPKRASPTISGDKTTESTPSDGATKSEKKGKKRNHEAVDGATTLTAEPPKKPGRKRGRPARNANTGKQKEGGDNVEWVQCEKCEKWRKLPPHISAGELPDTWYCALNTWNPHSASCESPEDKADAHHQEVGANVGQFLAGAAGKYSYRAMIFGTGKKHNRPTSERTRAAESLFQKQFEDPDDGPQTSVMYAKSSCFLPRTSNFTKANAIQEPAPSLFDALNQSNLFFDLRSAGMSGSFSPSSMSDSGVPQVLSFDRLPDKTKVLLEEAVLTSLESCVLTADQCLLDVQRRSWESISDEYASIKACLHKDIVIHTLLSLVRQGQIEMTCFRDPSIPIAEWIPRYRKVKSRQTLVSEQVARSSRCIKIAKPWKKRMGCQDADWSSGGAAFS